jgi:cytochrome c oxidase subunit 4
VADHAPSTQASGGEHGGHAHSSGKYYIIWVLLIALTLTTVLTGRLDLGSLNLPLALTIAIIKASLVVWFFMHMSEAAGVNRLVFAVSLLFVLVMLFGVFGDLWTRAPMSLPSAAPSTLGPEL